MVLSAADLMAEKAASVFDAALFDFDGTLAESYHVWRLVDETFLARRNLPYPDGLGAELASRGFRGGAAWLIDRYGLPDTVDQVCDEWNALGAELYLEQVRLRPGAAAYLRSLRRSGVRTALVTNNDPGVIAALSPHLAPDALFDAEVYGCEVGADKHSPDIYLEAARRLGADPARCVVFEDIPYGLASARGAGMAPVAVRSADPKQDVPAILSEALVMIDGFEGLG